MTDEALDWKAAWYALDQDNAALREERDEVRRVFDLQWAADQRAIKRWQAENPGRPWTWPDRADMVVWLFGQVEAAEAELSALRGEVENLAEIAQHGAADKPIGSDIWHAEIDRLSASLLSTLKGEGDQELTVSQSSPSSPSSGDPQARLSDGWRDIASAPVSARVEALTARGNIIQGRTTGRGPRGRRGANTVETSDGLRHVCTHWRKAFDAK